MSSVREVLRAAVEAARDVAIARGDLTNPDTFDPPPVRIERPARPEHGDYATNAAMQLAPVARMAPLRVAEALVARLKLPAGMGAAAVAAPGFFNIRAHSRWVGIHGAADPGGRDCCRAAPL